MGRFVRVVPVIFLAGLISSCSHSPSVTTTTTSQVPAHISLTPTPSASLEIGQTLTFTGSPTDSAATAISETVDYQSNNPTVLTISTGGLACAGSWDSLATPQVCTPGPAGVAQVTATVEGVSSPPTTVYVHQHIDNVTLSAAPSQPPPTSSICFSSGTTFNYQATAYDRAAGPAPGLDITSTVGPFTWTSTNTSVVTLTAATPTAPVTGLLAGQAMAKAAVPGITQIYTSVGGVTSVPLTFETCPVQSIVLQINGAPPSTLNVATGTSSTITTVIHDILGNLISGTFLTWNSSDLSSVTVSTAGAVSTPQQGGAGVIASCTPPTCNIGILPTLPIYPENAVQFVVSPAAGSTTSTVASSAWVSTTGWKGTDGCVSEVVSITLPTTTTTAPTLGIPVGLPATPNSMLIDRQGAKIYFGTDQGELGTKGLMVFAIAATTVSEYVSTPGKVLAVSPDGDKVVVSDTVDSPNQVYVFDSTNNTSVAYPITGATSADFSPDSLKAYILAGSTLYVYSKIDALQTISLSGSPTGVAFFPEGAFAYVAGEQPSTITVRKTCDNTIANSYSPTPVPQVIALPATPALVKSLPNLTVLAVDTTGLELIAANPMDPLDTTQSTPSNPAQSTTGTELTGCAPPSTDVPSGLPAISNVATSVNFGQGSFVPTQLIVSPDGSTAYVFIQNSGQVLVFNINQRTTSFMQLVNSAAALQAGLSADGSTLYVGASDGTVHLLDPLTGNDVQQLSFVQDSSILQAGLCANVTFPAQTAINITAAAQSGSNTTYTYTLTSGPALEVGTSIGIAGMANAADNGTFTITALSSGTFTVANVNGVTATGQNGTGTMTLACNPDLIVAKP